MGAISRRRGAESHRFWEHNGRRIDHYILAKTRRYRIFWCYDCGNGISSRCGSRHYLDHVQITVAESLGVEQPAAFVTNVRGAAGHGAKPRAAAGCAGGARRPAAFNADDLRNEKIKVLQSIRPYTPEVVAHDIIRGQYAAGTAEEKEPPGYRQEPGVHPQFYNRDLCSGAAADR